MNTRRRVEGGKVDYSKKYLTFKAIEDTTFTFSRNALQYSLDNGQTWTTLAADTASPTVTAGNKILWKQTGLEAGGTFTATGNFEAYGNIMSLYYGDNFIGQTDLTGKDFAFRGLFRYNAFLVSAENLILPATTLAQSCYSYMFYICTSLITAPELPATTLAQSCYSYMFFSCSSLTTAPELPATTLAGACYSGMFFSCSSLTTAPELPATTLADYCYSTMFYACTSLTTAPELPATTLADYCYEGMFRGCSSLTTAPELPATTLADYCYEVMFRGCTSLNYIKCLATTDIPASNCTSDWVTNVAATGTFVKATSNTSWFPGDSGIPSGWTSYNEDGTIYTPPTPTYIVSYKVASQTSGMTYSVSNDNKTYILNGNSTNNGTLLLTLTITATGPFNLKFTITPSSESGYDFGCVGRLDEVGGLGRTSNYWIRASGTTAASNNVVVSAGTHTIQIGYFKDSSASNNSDSVTIAITQA